MGDSEEQCKAKDKDMATSIADWQEHCHALESKATELSEALERIRNERFDNRDTPGYAGTLEGKNHLQLCWLSFIAWFKKHSQFVALQYRANRAIGARYRGI